MGLLRKLQNVWDSGSSDLVTDPVEERRKEAMRKREATEEAAGKNSTHDISGISVEMEIEAKTVRVVYSQQKGLFVFQDKKKIFESAKKKVPFYKFSSTKSENWKGPHDINILGHLLTVEYKEPTNRFLSWGFNDDGLLVSLDGKPSTGSANHPIKRIEKSSYGLFVLAATQIWGLLSAVLMEDPRFNATGVLFGFLIIIILATLAFTVKKNPRLSTGLGFIIGASITIIYVADFIFSHIQTGSSQFNVWPLLFWTSLMGGATLAIFRGFVGAVNEKRRNTFVSVIIVGVVLLLSAIYPGLVLIGLYAQESIQNVSWQDFHSEEFGFQAQFPSSPTHATQPIGDVTMDMFTSERWDGTFYAIIFYKEPERKKLPKKADAIQQIEMSLNALVTGNEGGRLVSHDISTFNGYPSANFTASFIGPLGRAGTMRGREILIEDGLYVVMVMGSSSQETHVERFIDSFKFLP